MGDLRKAIVFVYPKIEFEENYPCSWIPYSVLSLASSLNIKEYEIIIFDGNRKSDKDFIKILTSTEPFIVAFSVMTGGEQISHALKLASAAKQHNRSTVNIFGGPHINVLPEQSLKHHLVDLVVEGPGQEVIGNVVDAIARGGDMYDLPGVYYKLNGNICGGKENKTLKSLKAYNFTLTNISDYIQYDSTISDRTINYIASQGCPYSCNFCYETTYRRRYYKMPLDIIEKDLSYFVSQDINGIKFYDADFFVDTNQAVSISAMLETRGLKWAASVHPRDILRSENGGKNILLESIQNNCKRLLMGVESASDRVLQAIINKNAKREEMLAVAKRVAEYGILGSYTFMVGFPGETTKEQDDTFELINILWKLSPRPETNVHIYMPYPGTPLYVEALRCGFEAPNNLEDWAKFSYYKKITPWVTSELEKRAKEHTLLIDKTKR
jgi:radical SAM superfamily enzyme YgiQ (UPF0313 family)